MRIVALSVASVFLGFMMAVAWADHHEAGANGAKYSIKDVMKKAHKEGLLKKVLGEEASEQQKLQLLDLYLSLLENEPPQGSEESWVIKSGTAIVAAAKVAVGRDGAVADLKSATNCKACHQAHKPPSD